MARPKEFEAKLEVAFTADQLHYIEGVAQLAGVPKGNVVRFLVQEGVDRQHRESALSTLLGLGRPIEKEED